MAQLCQHQGELKQQSVEVLLISFGKPEEAKVWLEEICPSFQLLLDSKRRVYHAYNLESSFMASWNMKTLLYYVRALLSGRKWRGIKGSSTQLGGDFVINQDGRFLLVYRGKHATDRPQVSELLDALKE